MLAAMLVGGMVALVTPMAVGAEPQAGTPDSSPPTAIEQALIAHACGSAPVDAQQECANAQLLSLRADFGRDLSRLSAADRKALDSVCADIRVTGTRDAYLDCLSAQLVALRSRRNKTKPPPPPPADGTAVPPTPEGAPTVATATPATPSSPSSPSRVSWIIGGAVAILLLGGGGAFLALRTRRPPRKCRICGSDVPVAGELCQKCRSEAAAALRQAAADRAEQQRAQEEERRRQAEQEEEQRQQKAREEEDERLLLEKHEEERKRDEDVRRRQAEEARQRSQAVGASPEEFDPYAVLGVTREASKEDIQTAYEEAKAKSDPEQVSHLGMEVQDHFKAKTKAVERAYKALTEQP